jgi:GT2 family glycosyltransferase
MSQRLQFSIIMPTFERGKVFEQSINAAIEVINDFDAEIIVINDSKKTKIVLNNNNPKVKILVNPKSGVASARNLGARLAEADLLIFVDDDILINKHTLERTIELYKNNNDRCYNPNWIYPPDLDKKIRKTQFGRYLIQNGFTSLQGWNKGVKWDTAKAFEVNLVASYFLPIYKSSFNKINGYNEDFPHAGAEDHDFANRLKQSGIKAFIDPNFMVYHNEADRVYLNDWLNRKMRSGQTRKMAADLGYDETKIEHSALKSALLILIFKTKSIFRFILKSIPNYKTFDPVYFKIVNILLATYLLEGYRK